MQHLTEIKLKNKKKIIRLLYSKDNMSKKRIALNLNLSPSVITKLCGELINDGILVEANKIESESPISGRKEVKIIINPSYRTCIGIVINHKTTSILFTDLSLNVLYQEEIPTLSDANLHLNNTISLLRKLMNDLSLEKTSILGIGISIKGNTDGIYTNYGVWDCAVNIKDFFEEELEIPTVLDNGIRCSALLEQLHYSKDNFIFIKYGEFGIGGTLIKEHKLLYGENNNMVDVGHVIMNPQGEYCPICKRRGCLESIISIEKLVLHVKMKFSFSFSPILWNICEGDANKITLSNILTAADIGCIEINMLLKENASYFAIALINTYALLDTKKIIVIGKIFSCKRFITYLQSSLCEYQLTPIFDNIEFHIHDNILLSSIALALNHFLFL
ncbi:ROK family protein [Clostridium sp.]